MLFTNTFRKLADFLHNKWTPSRSPRWGWGTSEAFFGGLVEEPEAEFVTGDWQPSVWDEDDEAFEPTPIFWTTGEERNKVVHTLPTFIMVSEAPRSNRYKFT